MHALRWLLAGALIAISLVSQVAILTRLPLPGATPDLLLVVVVALAIAYGPGFGAFAGFLAGLGADLVPPADSAVGRWALVLALVGYAAGRLSSEMQRSLILPTLLVGVSAGAAVFGFAVTGAISGNSEASWRVVNQLIPSTVLYAAVLSPFIVSAVLAVARRLEPEPVISG